MNKDNIIEWDVDDPAKAVHYLKTEWNDDGAFFIGPGPGFLENYEAIEMEAT